MEENNDVEEDVVDPSNQDQESQEQSEQAVSEPQQGSQEYNFREMRKIVEEQQQRIRELENVRYQQPEAAVEEEEDSSSYDEDDFLTVKQAKKLAAKQVREMIEQQEFDTLEDRMRMKFKDYDDVVSEENVKKLVENDSDLTDSLRRAANPYATAYKLIKKSAFYSNDNELRNKKNSENERLHKNSQKPGSSNSVTKPLAKANSYARMSKGEMDALYQEMISCSRRN